MAQLTTSLLNLTIFFPTLKTENEIKENSKARG